MRGSTPCSALPQHSGRPKPAIPHASQPQQPHGGPHPCSGHMEWEGEQDACRLTNALVGSPRPWANSPSEVQKVKTHIRCAAKMGCRDSLTAAFHQEHATMTPEGSSSSASLPQFSRALCGRRTSPGLAGCEWYLAPPLANVMSWTGSQNASR